MLTNVLAKVRILYVKNSTERLGEKSNLTICWICKIFNICKSCEKCKEYEKYRKCALVFKF